MRGVLKIGLIVLILFAVLGFAAYKVAGPVGLIGFIVVIVALFFLGKKFAGAALGKLLTAPFQMKGAVLRGAKVRVHQVTETSGPVRRVTMGNQRDDDRESDAESRGGRRFFLVEVTVTPPGEDSGAFKSWEPGSLVLVPVGTSKRDIGNLNEDQQAQVQSYDLWEGTRFLHSDSEDDETAVEGEQRLRLLFSAGKNLTKVKFQYYLEFFGELDLPAASSEPLAAPPLAPPISGGTSGDDVPGAIAIDLAPVLPVNRAAVSAAGKLTTRLREEGELIGGSEDSPLYKISAAKVEGEDHLPDPPGQLRPEDLVTQVKVGQSNVKKLTQALNLTALEPIPQGGQANIAAAMATKVAEQKKSTSHLKWLSATAQQLDEAEAAERAQRDQGISPPAGAAPGPQKPRMTTRTIIPPAPKTNASLVAAAARSAAQLNERPAPAPQPVLIEDEPAVAVAEPVLAEVPVAAPVPILPEIPTPRPPAGPVGAVALPEPPGGVTGSVGMAGTVIRAPLKPGVIQAATAAPSSPGLAASTLPAGAYGLPKLAEEDRPAPITAREESIFEEPAPVEVLAETTFDEVEPEPEFTSEPEPVPQFEEEVPSMLFAEVESEPLGSNTFAGPDIDPDELAAAVVADSSGEFVLPPGAKVSAEEMRVPAYYLVVNGPPEGPYSLENLFNRLADGTLQLTDFTWKEGMPEWVSIETVLSEISE